MSDRHNKRPHSEGCRRKFKTEDNHTNDNNLTSSCTRKKRRAESSTSPSSSNSTGSSLTVEIDPDIIELSDSDSSASSVQFISSDSPGSSEPSNDEFTFRYPDTDSSPESIRLGLQIQVGTFRNRLGVILASRNFNNLYSYGGVVPVPRNPRMPANQQDIWRSQQADAENRRRRSTITTPIAGTSSTSSNTSSSSSSSSNSASNMAATNSAPAATTSTATMTSGNAGENRNQMVRQAAFRAFVRTPDARSIEDAQRYSNLLEFHHMVMPYLIRDEPTENGLMQLGDRLTMSVIDNLTTEYQYSSAQTCANKDCAICMEEYVDGQQLRSLPCLHSFHKECVDRWLCEQFKCPICRYNFIERAGELRNNPPTTDGESYGLIPQEDSQG